MFDDPERSAWDRPGLDEIAWDEESRLRETATAVKERAGGEKDAEGLIGFMGALGLRADGRRRADDDDDLEEDYDDEEFDDEDEVDDDFDDDFDDDDDVDDDFEDDFEEDEA